MKRKEEGNVLLIIIFVITAILGGVAVWIGWRLSREEEVTPEESSADTAAPNGVCEPDLDCELTVNSSTDCGNIPITSSGRISQNIGDYVQSCNSDCSLGQMSIWEFICRGPMTDEICQVCYIDGNCGSEPDFFPSSDARCDCSGCSSQMPPTDTPCHCCYSDSSGWNQQCLGLCVDEGPGYGSNGYSPKPSGTFDSSDPDYRCRNVQIDIWVDRGDSSSGTLILKCQMDPDGNWGPPSESPGWDFYTCEEEAEDVYVCGDTGCGSEGDICNDGTTCHSNGGAMTCCNECTDGTWSCSASNSCECEAVLDTDLSCDDLSAAPSSVPASGGDVTLSASSTATNVQITGYTYGADIGTVTESMPNSMSEASTATWDIPNGLEGGSEYNAWVTVSSEGEDDAGCSGEDDCTTGDEECQVSVTIQDEDLPYFDAEKTSSVECINNNTAAEITYQITVSNISDVSGTVYSVVDTYDERFESSWVGSISPTPDSHEGNVITWDNDGEGWTLGAGESLPVFSYVVTVPSDYFGEYINGEFVPYEYENFAVVRTENEDFELETTVEIECPTSPSPTPSPGTGIFDTATNAGVLAVLLITAGFVILRIQQPDVKFLVKKGLRIWPIKIIAEKVVFDLKKEKFEKKALDDVDDEE